MDEPPRTFPNGEGSRAGRTAIETSELNERMESIKEKKAKVNEKELKFKKAVAMSIRRRNSEILNGAAGAQKVRGREKAKVKSAKELRRERQEQVDEKAASRADMRFSVRGAAAIGERAAQIEMGPILPEGEKRIRTQTTFTTSGGKGNTQGMVHVAPNSGQEELREYQLRVTDASNAVEETHKDVDGQIVKDQFECAWRVTGVSESAEDPGRQDCAVDYDGHGEDKPQNPLSMPAINKRGRPKVYAVSYWENALMQAALHEDNRGIVDLLERHSESKVLIFQVKMTLPEDRKPMTLFIAPLPVNSSNQKGQAGRKRVRDASDEESASYEESPSEASDEESASGGSSSSEEDSGFSSGDDDQVQVSHCAQKGQQAVRRMTEAERAVERLDKPVKPTTAEALAIAEEKAQKALTEVARLKAALDAEHE